MRAFALLALALALAAAGAAAEGPPCAGCAPPGTCFKNSGGGLTLFGHPGKVINVTTMWSCSNSTEHPVEVWPEFVGINNLPPGAEAGPAVFAYGGPEPCNCTIVLATVPVRAFVTIKGTINFTSWESNFVIAANFPRSTEPRCPKHSSYLCDGTHKWTRATYEMPACDKKTRCCLTSFEAQRTDNGATLSLDGAVDGACSKDMAPFLEEQTVFTPPMANSSLVFSLRNHTVTGTFTDDTFTRVRLVMADNGTGDDDDDDDDGGGGGDDDGKSESSAWRTAGITVAAVLFVVGVGAAVHARRKKQASLNAAASAELLGHDQLSNT